MTAHAIHVWIVSLELDAARQAELCDVLSADEQQRAAEFRLEQPRRQFVVARAALRTLLAGYLQRPLEAISLTVDSNGKPRLDERRGASDWRFNIAHSAELALVALTTGCEIGVDLERLRSVRHGAQVARRFFHPTESAILADAPPQRYDALFMRCWTSKEAVLKATGRGVIGPLAGFQVPIDEHAGVWIELPESRCWLQQLALPSGYVGAVATLNAQRTLHRFTFPG